MARHEPGAAVGVQASSKAMIPFVSIPPALTANKTCAVSSEMLSQ